MTSSAVSQSTVTSSDRFMGRVKWFNNKAGYGFITVTDGHKAGSDIFVHHSSIKVDAQQYKYLVQGEYVEFGLSSVSNGDHEFQASDVSGIKSGKLMCETRHELLSTRTNYKAQTTAPVQVQTSAKPVRQPAASHAPWTPVKKPRQQAVPVDDSRTPSGPSAGRGAGRGSSGGRVSTAGRGGRGAAAGRGRGKATA